MTDMHRQDAKTAGQPGNEATWQLGNRADWNS